LSLLALVLAGSLWTGIAFFAWDPANDLLRGFMGGLSMPTWFPDWIPSRSLWIPLIILIVTIPAVLITALVLVGLFGTSLTAKRVGNQYGLIPQVSTGLARSASVIASVWHSSWVLAVLALIWLLSLVLYPLMGVGVLVQLMALAWANAKLFSRDVLLDFADSHERAALIKTHRGALWSLGLIASVPAAIPSIMWLGGAMATIALPVMALIAVWLYVMIFLATSLLFSHYLLPALQTSREQTRAAQDKQTAQVVAVQAPIDALTIESNASTPQESSSPTQTLPLNRLTH
jgi:hypothetical protein